MRAMSTCLVVAVILIVGAVVRGEEKPIYITSLTSTTMPSIEMKEEAFGEGAG